MDLARVHSASGFPAMITPWVARCQPLLDGHVQFDFGDCSISVWCFLEME